MLCFVHLLLLLALLDHKFVFEHRSLSDHNTMKITLPLSFLLCLPVMAMATDSAPDADAVLLRAVDTEAGQSKLSKFDEDGKTNRRRQAKAVKSAKATRRLSSSKAAKSVDAKRG